MMPMATVLDTLAQLLLLHYVQHTHVIVGAATADLRAHMRYATEKPRVAHARLLLMACEYRVIACAVTDKTRHAHCAVIMLSLVRVDAPARFRRFYRFHTLNPVR